MTRQSSLPFEVGQEAEAKTFMGGFRGAWFRCKIKSITSRKREIWHAMEYYDYPDDKVQWTKVYQVPPKTSRNRKRKAVRKQLMVRPEFPRICHENEMSNIHTISEVTVVVDGSWRVGDLVDWWADGGFWSGTIIEIESDDMVKFKLYDPPHGEGSTYSVSCKELRPSLDWSPEHGWEVLTPQEVQHHHSCPRLIKPVKQDDGQQYMKNTPSSTLEFNESMSSHTSSSPLPHKKGSIKSKDCQDTSKKEVPQTQSMDPCVMGSVVGKPGSPDSISGTFCKDDPSAVLEAVSAEEQYPVNETSKKTRTNDMTSVNLRPCSIDSAITDLEVMVNRVKWLRGILKLGTTS